MNYWVIYKKNDGSLRAAFCWGRDKREAAVEFEKDFRDYTIVAILPAEWV